MYVGETSLAISLRWLNLGDRGSGYTEVAIPYSLLLSVSNFPFCEVLKSMLSKYANYREGLR